MSFWVIIPARFNATRLPGKPLRLLKGKPMLQHVFERAKRSGAQRVVIATDDGRIRQAAEGFGAEVCMTSPACKSGTERLAEAVEKLACPKETIVVNLQGDEPLMPPSLLDQVAGELASHREADMATLYVPITSREELLDPHAVKVVMDGQGYALYFSRAPIPFHDHVAFHHRHIGLYAYRAAFLGRFASWPPSPLEVAESLEQLRVLWHGGKIRLAEAREPCPPGVDTQRDLERAEALLSLDEA